MLRNDHSGLFGSMFVSTIQQSPLSRPSSNDVASLAFRKCSCQTVKWTRTNGHRLISDRKKCIEKCSVIVARKYCKNPCTFEKGSIHPIQYIHSYGNIGSTVSEHGKWRTGRSDKKCLKEVLWTLDPVGKEIFEYKQEHIDIPRTKKHNLILWNKILYHLVEMTFRTIRTWC